MAAQLSYKPFSADGKNSYQLNLAGDTFYDDKTNFDFGNGLKGSLKIDPRNRSVATLDFGTQAIPEGFKPSFVGDLFESRSVPTLADMTESSSPVVVDTPPVVDMIQSTAPYISQAVNEQAKKDNFNRGQVSNFVENNTVKSPAVIPAATTTVLDPNAVPAITDTTVFPTAQQMSFSEKIAAEKAEKAKQEAEEQAAFEEGYKGITSRVEPIVNYLNAERLNKLSDGGKRANELIARIQNKTATQSDVDELTAIKQSVETVERKQGVQTGANNILNSALSGVTDYSGAVKPYDTSFSLPNGDYALSKGLSEPAPTTADKVQTVGFTPETIDTSKLNTVNKVDLSTIPKADVSYAAASQVDVNNPAYQVTPDKVTTGNATKGLIGQARTNQIKVADNQLASNATQDLVNNSKTTNWNVDPNQLTSSNLTGLLWQDSKYLQDARNRGMRTANARGMLNSAIAAGLAEEAAIAAAAPIAQADAGVYANSAQANALADNTRLNKGMELNAQAISNDALTQFNAAKENTAALNDTLKTDAQTYWKQADLDQRASESNAANKLTADSNYAALQANLNSQNSDRTTNIDIANKRADNESSMNFATNQTAALTNNAQWQNQADLKSTELGAQDQWNNSELSTKVEMYNSGEYNSAEKFDAANKLDLQKLGIQLETDKNKTVAGWNVENYRAKFQAFTQSERDAFIAGNDFKKLFSAQNFELNQAVTQTMLDVLRDDNSAEAQKQRDTILDTYAKENQMLADDGAMERTIYTTDSQFNNSLLDRELERQKITLNSRSDFVKNLLNANMEILKTGDMSGAAKANAIAQAYQLTAEGISLINDVINGDLTDWVMDKPAEYIPDSTIPKIPETTPNTTATTGSGMIGTARKSVADITKLVSDMTDDEIKELSKTPEGKAAIKRFSGLLGQAWQS